MSKIVISITTDYISSRISSSDLSRDEFDRLVNPQTIIPDEKSNVLHGTDEKFRP